MNPRVEAMRWALEYGCLWAAHVMSRAFCALGFCAGLCLSGRILLLRVFSRRLGLGAANVPGVAVAASLVALSALSAHLALRREPFFDGIVAEAAERRGAYEEAAGRYAHLIEEGVARPSLYDALGLLSLRLGRYPQAIAAFHGAQSLSATPSPERELLCAAAHERLGDAEMASAHRARAAAAARRRH